MLHVYRASYNLKQQLKDRHFPDVAIKSVLDDIFGSQQDKVFTEGLGGSLEESIKYQSGSNLKSND